MQLIDTTEPEPIEQTPATEEHFEQATSIQIIRAHGHKSSSISIQYFSL